MESEKNLFVGFRAVFESPECEKVFLRVTASSLYRAFVNGEFFGYGPARAPHGWFRVDLWDLTPYLRPGNNVVAIEVAGYNVNSYYVLDQPSFLQAEVTAQGKVLASTAGTGMQFEATVLTERLRKVQRYSFQRSFIEVYRLSPNYSRWRKDPEAIFPRVPCSVLPEKRLLPRRAPYPNFTLRAPLRLLSYGNILKVEKVEHPRKVRSLTDVGPKLKGYPEEELEKIPSIELQSFKISKKIDVDKPFAPTSVLELHEKTFHIVDFGANLTGFIGARVRCKRPTHLYMVFDEILSNGDVDWMRLGCINIVTYEMPEGIFNIESFEPYTLRYLKIIVTEGECEVENIYIREYANPDVWRAHFASSDQRLNRLFEIY